MAKKEYWKSRFKQLENAQHSMSLEKAMQIQEQFDKSLSVIERQIDMWYARLAVNNNVSMAEAKRMLSAKELKEFRWSVEEYIKYGKDNGIEGKWAKELENASARVHINRLESLKYQIQAEAEKLYGNYLDDMDRHIADMYNHGYYHTAFEIQRGTGVGSSFRQLDTRMVEQVIHNPWAADGRNFSERIWTDKTKLINTLYNEITLMVITGDGPDRAIKKIQKEMMTSRRNATRIVMTESAAFATKARNDCMKELGVQEYEVVETLDSHTCPTCQDMDNTHYPMSEHIIGVTAPPFHPSCRGCTCPYFHDEFTEGEQRAARNEDGKTYYVPSDMTYKEWKKSFVDGKTENLTEASFDGAEEKFKRDREKFKEKLENGETSLHRDKMLLYNEMTEYQRDSKLKTPFGYDSDSDVIKYNPSAPEYSKYDINYVLAHELSHRMDMLEYNSFDNESFNAAIEKSKEIAKKNKELIASWFITGGKFEQNFAISDIISALTSNKIVVPVGHKDSYWKKDNRNVCLEIFANISAMDVLEDTAMDDFKSMFEDLFNTYKEMVK